MTAIAALPMYALPEMAAANLSLWTALRDAAGLEVPEALSPSPLALPGTIAPETVFSQMCGYPLKKIYQGQYRLLGTPLYDLPGCRLRPDGVPTHCSFLIAHADASLFVLEHLRGKSFVMNGQDSNSGMNLARRLIAPWARDGRFFGEVTVSGSHLRSMEMVADGLADAATIDCVTFGFVARYRPDLTARLRVLCETPASPAIPFITASATPLALAAQLTRALTDPLPAPALAAAFADLSIRRVAPPRPEAYDAVLAMEMDAAAMGYATLR
ncbi:PhnD/SsuA/transferrin family substrate-binding protein [Acidisoma cellulosilytica]|uniref:PhnD/SsuA/transferrin family substrate-binding protein n=1 Tax=Acidisoma cellulosilyticum TaxID=2802395 RepID=A0A963YZP0_9PROT|nr:PhnD/SsuA/transferrin family substrate-binding protein [Acidisoma cellulosilyticum]MCB8879834.1 PhnD/SsuA/transferrin family substrate-binding protein [Acidisoma cellulosilyticum]